MTVVAVSDPREKAQAKREIAHLVMVNEMVIKVLTAEQANKAQRVVREAGHR